MTIGGRDIDVARRGLIELVVFGVLPVTARVLLRLGARWRA